MLPNACYLHDIIVGLLFWPFYGSAHQVKRSHVGQQDKKLSHARSHKEATVQDIGAWAEGCESPSGGHAGELSAPQESHQAEHDGQDGGEHGEGERSIPLAHVRNAVHQRNAAAFVGAVPAIASAICPPTCCAKCHHCQRQALCSH